MHNAVEQDRLEIVRFLIEAGAKFDQPTQESGITPLHRAADYGLIESVRLLVNAGADLHSLGGIKFDLQPSNLTWKVPVVFRICLPHCFSYHCQRANVASCHLWI